MAGTNSRPHQGQLKVAPARPGSFLWGNLAEYQREGLNFFLNAWRDHGDVVRIRFGPNVLYQINHPEGAQHVLQANNRNYGRQTYGNDLIKLVTGLNLFTSDGDYWLRQRRLMQPAFHRRRITSFGKIMTDATLRMLERWQPAIERGEWLDMHEEMMRITMEIVGRALFSVDLSDESSVLGQAFLVSTEYVNYRFNVGLAWPIFVPTRRNRALKTAMRNVQKIMQEMLDERRRTRVRKDDLMDILMEARYEDTGEGMTDEQLRAELGVVIGAGQETTSNALTWAFHMLSEHPEVEAKLLLELETVLAGRLPTMDDLPNLPYTRRVIDETMRMYPPAWALSTRNLIADDNVMEYAIPKGAFVFILPYILHHDPRFWDQPEQFDPDRFSEERAAGRHKYAYIPFGAGPRKCIGNTLALIEAQLILATVLQRVKLSTRPGYQAIPDPVFTLRVKDGLPMRVQPRKVKAV